MIEKGPHIVIKQGRYFDFSDISVYRISSSESDMDIYQQSIMPFNSFSHQELIKKISTFGIKGNENLMYAFVDPVIYGERYMVKKNLDYNRIRRGEFQGSDLFIITESDIDKIVKFCEKNENIGDVMKIKCNDEEGKITFKDKSYSFLDQYYLSDSSVKNVHAEFSKRVSSYTYNVNFEGKDSLSFIPAKLEIMKGNYLVIDFNDIFHTIVTYKENGSSWEPFSIERDGVITYFHEQEVLDPERESTLDKTLNYVKTEALSIIDKTQTMVKGVISDIRSKLSEDKTE